jgi:hypothetical protein
MSEGRKEPTRDALIRIAHEAEIELWIGESESGEAEYATILDDDIQKHFPIMSQKFRKWLIQQYYKETQRGPNNQALQEALSTLTAEAMHGGVQFKVWVRVAKHFDTIYIDMADNFGRAININAGGYSIITNPPVKFIRREGMLPLPEPERGGQLIGLLSKFLNFSSTDDLALIAGWLVVTMQPRGPYPLLVLQGEQGTAKSTAAKFLRSIIDPHKAPIRTPSRDDRDLILAAVNGWMMMLDNVSGLPNWLSDALARIATGIGFSTRKLYSDSEETVIAISRPICINGIDDCITRGDLLDRSIIMNLEPIPGQKRMLEKKYWNKFRIYHAAILGSLCDALSTSIDNEKVIEHSDLPRMADATKIAANAAPSWGMDPRLWVALMHQNRQGAVEANLDGSVLAVSIKALLSKVPTWEGTATNLLLTLNDTEIDRDRPAKIWPQDPRTLSMHLNRLAPMLRQSGIAVDINKSNGVRKISLEMQHNSSTTASLDTMRDCADAKIRRNSESRSRYGLKEGGGIRW